MDQLTREHLIEVSDKNLDMHQETKNMSHSAINNIIFSISTGTLIISVTFIGYIKTVISFPWVLIASWFCLLCTIALNAMVHNLMIKQARRQIQLINFWRSKGFPDAANFENEIVDKDKLLGGIVLRGRVANTAVIGFLFLGIIGLFLFVSINLYTQNRINLEKQQGPLIISEKLQNG